MAQRCPDVPQMGCSLMVPPLLESLVSLLEDSVGWKVGGWSVRSRSALMGTAVTGAGGWEAFPAEWHWEEC